MTSQPRRPQTRFRESFVSMASEGYVTTEIQVAANGRYTMELVASGTEAEGVYPLVNVLLNDKKVGAVQLTVGGWRSYPLELKLTTGTHRLTLDFVNDLYVPGVGDRNVSLDRALFYRKDETP